MRSQDDIPDRRQRDAAETTFDRNIVVIAGAGTGKTTLLVNRLIHLLMKEPEPVPITRLVALTFTNKAATEMKVRLRERLWSLLRPAADDPRSDGGAVSAQDLRARYHLSPEILAGRAEAALRDLEKAQIGTLHSFAAHVLRLHPLESGVDPAFQEDDGSRFAEHFAAAWDLWIDRELSRRGSHHAQWRTLLRQVSLEEVRSFAQALCSELVDPARLQDHREVAGDAVVCGWLSELHDQANRLLQAHDGPKRRKVEQMLAAAAGLFGHLAEKGSAALLDRPAEERALLAKEIGNPVGGWEPADFKEAARLIKTAQACLHVDEQFFKQALSLLTPLVTQVRDTFVQGGWLSFDGLLARARRLLLDHPAVRERIKQDYRAILVDEFQDTDPVQYEIILAVAERLGTRAADWKDMALEPGKLFIVGDPKQSIYAFRRADIEAFDRVVEKIEAEQGSVQTLTTNFRSDAAVLEPVNDVFDRLFERRPHVQPANVRLTVRPNRRQASIDPGVHLQVVGPSDREEPFDSAGATRAEAEALAQWLRDEVLARPSIKPGHVALLFRKLTQADVYLDALRRYGLSYVIEGEKHFYRRQEVIDLINMLRVLDNPHDAIALTGVLRGPLGGLTDREVYDLRQAGCFDYRKHRRLGGSPLACAEPVRRLYDRLDRLHRDITTLALSDAIQRIFETVPLLDLAAASLHGEQAVANLLKAKHTAASLADRPHLTLSGFVELMIARLDEQPDEAESPLVEESPEAVQVLTIHKAKGLEFPIVILPGLHQGQGNGRERSLPAASYDWSSGAYGLSLGDRRTLGSVLIQEKWRLREEAERRRVLYVGMTRAKELLVLSGGLTARSNGDTVLGLLQEVGEGEVGAAATSALRVGESAIPQRVRSAPERRRPRRAETDEIAGPAIDVASIAAWWERRTIAWDEARRTPRHLTPTLLGKQAAPEAAPAPPFRKAPGPDAEVARMAGILAHRILEQWDFADDPVRFDARIATAVAAGLAPEQRALAEGVTESLRELFKDFGRSESYARLRAATILGREIPFLMPWGGTQNAQVMDGVIDVLYRLDGQLWIADYKTDTVSAEEAAAHAERYRPQSEVYKAAVTHSLGSEPVRFHCLFLRCAMAVEL
ncbi:UvrD-helicase domain-containing protein [Nitrospira moscoviensis]|uniref:DNA 3'-5' helicase n=1 Tax=Nitrospira moscoviensis TaxID=42253 RepID=A0A0K2GCJ6_NITMO|nr:UvrD-helicase domain-containing protein [Nitrospira moscoviensis]ALA58680.1 hypothetical protein NITMOv2_2264 [Nitrospira moscoviensis]